VMTVGYLNRYVTLTKVILHLVLVYVGNWCGCLLVAYFLGYLTHIYDAEQYRGYLDGLVQQKLQNESMFR
jgi:formate/nitrite transporter FocA (FNT family)